MATDKYAEARVEAFEKLIASHRRVQIQAQALDDVLEREAATLKVRSDASRAVQQYREWRKLLSREILRDLERRINNARKRATAARR